LVLNTCTHGSFFYRWLTVPPACLSGSEARILAWVRHLARALEARAERQSAALRRAWEASGVRRLMQSPPCAESLVLRLACDRGGTALVLWPLAAYVLVDYLLRRLAPAGALAAAWDELLLLLGLATWAGKGLWRGRLCWRPTPVTIPFLVYAGLMVFLWGVRSPDVAVATEGVRVYLQYTLWFFVTLALVDRPAQVRFLSAVLVAVAALLALHGVYQYLTGAPMPVHWVDVAEQSPRTRAYSLVNSPNVLGSLLALAVPQALGHLLAARTRPQRWTLAGLLAALLAGLVVTFSRGAWFATCLALLLFGLLTRPLLLLPLTAASVTVPLLLPSVRARLTYLFSTAYVVSSQRAGRLARWEAALTRIQASPLLGEGPGRFGGAVAARHLPGSFYVDNFYLKTAAETGLPGLAAYLWLLLNVLRGGMAAYRNVGPDMRSLAAGLLAGLVGVLAHNLVENIFEVPAMASYFWLAAGLLFALPPVNGGPQNPTETQGWAGHEPATTSK
jgi:O-antigen ligase